MHDLLQNYATKETASKGNNNRNTKEFLGSL
jgi:hypothetical protein